MWFILYKDWFLWWLLYYKCKDNNICIINGWSVVMKLCKILKSMFNNYCKMFKDVLLGNMFW